MGFFELDFDSYQNVRSNIAKIAVPAWMAFYWVVVQYVLPANLAKYLLSLPEEWLLPGLLATIFVPSCILSFVAANILEIHDHVYDRYLVRWRSRYDRTTVLPALLRPYAASLPHGFMTAAASDMPLVLDRLFYDYVGDRDTRIRKNLLVRTYEALTKYWSNQMYQVAFICGLLLLLARLLYDAFGGRVTASLLHPILILLMGVGVSKILDVFLRRAVAQATLAEIRDIHDKYGVELGCRISELARALNLRLDE